ncbi:helix-turn-helix domain-containing protein [Streptomyces sp. NPDC051569]|uniref:helix-turn-helix domain-containing protein n=1 Tax=Streptomyces sp. NPDC051569 TaxID=3365661 RepID=UPI003791C381
MARRTEKPSTVLGRQLGEELRKFRESAGITMASAAEALDCTKGKISRIENGRVAVRTPDVLALLRAYGVEQEGEIATRLTDLARTANRRRRTGWWNQYGPVLADTYRDYIALEATASTIRTFQGQLIPGLLQTADYVRAVTVASKAWQTPSEIEQFVRVRLARQERLVADDPLSVWAVVAEGVLRQQVGGPNVMSAQLEHLMSVADLPNVQIQILPFHRGAHASMFGPYVILSFTETSALDVVLADNPTGSIWLEHEPEVARYRALFDDARSSALSPAESLSLIHKLSKEHGE